MDVRLKGSATANSALAASFFDASEDCVKIIGLGGELLAMNANGICLLEIEDFESLRGRPWAEMWPAAEQGAIEGSLNKARAGEWSKFHADCPTAAGTEKSWEVVVWPVLGDDGRPREIISVSRDVTERRRADEHRELLSLELAHRIKNMFAVVDGVIALSAKTALEAKPFAEALRARLHALGRAIAYVSPPEVSGREGEADRSLLGLLRELLSPYGGEAGPAQRVFIAGDDAEVGAGATTSLALIVNELATNAMKYGPLGLVDGRVELRVTRRGESVNIAWREYVDEPGHGVGEIDQPGFGSVLLENAVVRQLNGTFTRELTPKGLVVDVTIPTERLLR